MQEEVEGQNVSKVTICFPGETSGDIDRPLDGDNKGDFRSHIEEVVFHAGMGDLHRHLIADVAVTATHASYILTVNREVVVHADMDDFHRRLVAGVAVTAKNVSAILTVNRDKKREISLAVSSKDKRREILLAVSSKDRKREISLAVSGKDRKYRADRMEELIVEYKISKEKTTQQVSFADEQVHTMNIASSKR